MYACRRREDTRESLTALGERECSHKWPQVLPGGKTMLFTASANVIGSYDNDDLVIQPLPAGARWIVQRGGYYERYLPSGPLVYLRSGTLFAAPFMLTGSR